MVKRYVIETKSGYVRGTSSGDYTKDLNSARTFKTETAAKANRHITRSWLSHYEAKIVPVNVIIEKA